jgi:hypothetical protein
MTVCIGALCDGKEIENTANIILCADTLVTFTSDGTPTTSNPNGSKIFPLPLGFRCAVADDLTDSHIFVSKLVDGMRGLSPNDPGLYDKIKLAIEKTNEYIRNWRRLRVVAEFGVSLDEFLHDPNLAVRQQIQEELAISRIPIEMIVAGFSGTRPILFYTDSVTVQEQTSLGFFTATDSRAAGAGSGGDLALSWLNFRQQMLFMSSQRTFFHVLEAKKFSELNPLVGTRTIILFMAPGHTSMLDLDRSTPQLVKNWGSEFHVKPTIRLDEDKEHDILFGLFEPLSSER